MVDASAFLGFLVSLFLQKSIVKPVVEIAGASLAVAGGAFTRVKAKSGNDEVTDLIGNFNGMVDSLESNAKTMRMTIEEGRALARCLSFPDLIDTLSRALELYAGDRLDFRLFVRANMVDRGGSNEKYVEVSVDGQVGSELKEADDFTNELHVAARSHDGKVRCLS